MDKDLVCHRFKTSFGRGFQCLMFVEFKSRGAQLSKSQKDTMFLVDQMFRNDRTTPTKRARKHLGNVPKRAVSSAGKCYIDAKAFGYHLVRMNGDTPENSSEIWWDKTRVTLPELISILKFDTNPDTLEEMNWRIHHAKEKQPEFPLTTVAA